MPLSLSQTLSAELSGLLGHGKLSSVTQPTTEAVCGRHVRSAFVDLQPYWTGGAGQPVKPKPEDESTTFTVPKTGQNLEWLGVVEDSKVLDNTDLIQENFIGTIQNKAQAGQKDIPGPAAPGTQPGSENKCEEFLTYPPKWPWWHPAFVFKDPVHSVRVRLYDMTPPLTEKEKLWDVYFTGGPGGLNKITNSATPTGGEKPQFKPFCPPFSAKAKYELRLTEADGKPPAFDEKLTLLPAAAAGKARLKYIKNGSKPRVPTTTIIWEDGAVRNNSGGDAAVDEDMIYKLAPKDEFGRPNFF